MTTTPAPMDEKASACFMCTHYRPHGCLECRTHRLLSDIRSGLYEKMGVEQNRAEWEERALKAEQALEDERKRVASVVQIAQGVLTALNVGNVASESPLHLKLRETMIAYRANQ